MKFLFAIAASTVLFGQLPQFEVASIRPSSRPGAERINVGLHIDGAQLRCTYLSLADYIDAAYKLKHYQISGPDWIPSERFDISATLPAGAAQEQVPAMLQALLVDRFEMKFHWEKKDFPVYALVLAKGGLKATPSAYDSESAGDRAKAPINVSGTGGRGGVNIDLGHGSYFTLADNKFVARKLTMASFADNLARFEDRPVVDMTGVAGNYDINLDFTQEDYQAMLMRSAIAAGIVLPPEALKAMENASGDSLLAALEKVGLKLDRRKAPLDVIMIDHILKTPTEN